MVKADFLQRSELLFGRENVEKIEAATVCVCGVGGVGSYAAEALARSGTGHMKIIDFDEINCSNINRLLQALHSTVGRCKAEVEKERIADINPLCETEIITERINAKNAAELIGRTDFCIDAVDDVRAKIAIIKYCIENKINIVSVMGTGNKTAPEKLEICDISQTYNCPLAKAVRLALRREGINKGLTVIFSPELPVKNHGAANEVQTVGSCSFVPSAAGLMAASVVIRKITE